MVRAAAIIVRIAETAGNRVIVGMATSMPILATVTAGTETVDEFVRYLQGLDVATALLREPSLLMLYQVRERPRTKRKRGRSRASRVSFLTRLARPLSGRPIAPLAFNSEST